MTAPFEDPERELRDRIEYERDRIAALTAEQDDLQKEIVELQKEIEALEDRKVKECVRLEDAMRELEQLKANSRQLKLF